MSMQSDWALPREGVTLDTLISSLKLSIGNPLLTLPLYILSKYTASGQQIAAERPLALKALKVFLALGLYGVVRAYMDHGAVNNWKKDKYDWKKELVVVTGGSDGIGARVVQMLAAKGVQVVVMDIQPLKFAAPPNVYYFECDLADPKQIKSVCADVINLIGHPTVLVNNAGFARGKTIMDTSPEDLRLTYQINTLCHFHLIQQFLPDMIKKDHGMVVTVASYAGFVCAPRLVDYCGSKAAAVATHEGLGAELATVYGAPRVRTVLVCQNYTKTALFEGFDKGDGFFSVPLETDTVAEAIAKAVLKGESDTIFLPRSGHHTVAGFRGASLWWQSGIRKRTVKLMSKFEGRQVAQPSESKSVESSGVLI